MHLCSVFDHYLQGYRLRYGSRTTSEQWSAINAILGCQSGQYGELLLSCGACHHHSQSPRSCGHRSCSRCQSHTTTQWLQRQTAKLLPVRYFMATFTLPRQLRTLAKRQPTTVYNALFQCAVDTLKTFGRNSPRLNAELAMTAVLHTHTRRLDYHPHVHVVVPGGGINQKRNQWHNLKGKYLFNGRQLARVFRARLLATLRKAGLHPPQTPSQWVVHCQSAGRGLPALQYLSCYLYRGVIRDRNILADDGQTVTFQYRDSATNTLKTRSLAGEDFMALVLQHVLPTGFRRVRDYGFLHGNGKRLLRIVQWALQVAIPHMKKIRRPAFLCPLCQQPMSIVGFCLKRRTG